MKDQQNVKTLSPGQLLRLTERIEANADRLIERHLAARKSESVRTRPTSSIVEKNPHERRGRPAKRILNPFYGLTGPMTVYERYPIFTQDIMAGIARLDWHDRPIGKGGSSKPLSVRKLMLILEGLEEITAQDVADVIGTQLRHAQRYVKALELAIPFLMKSRPARLVYEMDSPQDELANSTQLKKLVDPVPGMRDQLNPPMPDGLEKLWQDLGEDAFDPDHVIYAAYCKKTQKASHPPTLSVQTLN